jgi:hypothetical protein
VIELACNAGAVALPFAPVVTVAVSPPANVPPGPVAGAEKVTLAPLTAFPFASRTVAVSGTAKVVAMVTLCGVPAVAEIEAAGPAVLVRVNAAEKSSADATTWYVPALALAVSDEANTAPAASVTPLVVSPPAKAPLGPVDGAAKVTLTPGTGLPAASLTTAWSVAAKVVKTVVLCGVPAIAVMLAAAPADTEMPLWVAVNVPLPGTVAVMDCVPAVLSVTLKVWLPASAAANV